MMRTIRLISLFIVTGWLTACSMLGVYNIPSIDGRIVDAETESPIEGAVIVIQRGLKGGYEGGIPGYYKYQEAVTDKNGAYNIPSLGVVYTGRRFDGGAPEIIVFKAGYKVKYKNNKCSTQEFNNKECNVISDPLMSWNQYSIWNGHTLALEIFNGTAKEYKELLLDLKTKFDSYDLFRKARCDWSGFEMPMWLRAIRTAGNEYNFDISIDTERKDCPQWEKFEKEYK